MGKTLLMVWGLVACVFAEEQVQGGEDRVMQVRARRLDLHDGELSLAKTEWSVDESEFKLPYGLEYGALFEMEVAHSEGSTDTTMSTVELGAGWQATGWMHGDVVFLYEENDTDPMRLDQLYLTLGNPEELPLYLQVGQFYAPFGNFDTFFISDPVVQELAEGLEKGATFGWTAGGLNAGVTVFDSEVRGKTRNAILAASYGLQGADCSLDAGVSWIRNILDADGLIDVLRDASYSSAEETAGLNAWMTVGYKRVTLIAEYVQALNHFEVDGLDTGLSPASVNLELGFRVSDLVELGAKYEYSKDISDWFAHRRCGAVCNVTVIEHEWVVASVACEYLREEYNEGLGADRVAMQFAVEF